VKVKYQFTNGDVSEVEVTDELGNILNEMDRDIANSDRRETRRHTSLDSMTFEGDIFADAGVDIVAQFEAAVDIETLHDALHTLLPRQKELLKKIYFDGRTIASVAAEEGVTEGAIRDRLRKTHARIKKLL
jgi:RNA polymerase sigma factor (sigma-70 family)